MPRFKVTKNQKVKYNRTLRFFSAITRKHALSAEKSMEFNIKHAIQVQNLQCSVYFYYLLYGTEIFSDYLFLQDVTVLLIKF